MGILGKVIESVASEALVDALEIPINVLDRATKKLEEKSNQNKRQLFECAPGEKALLINQKTYTWRERFNIYDSVQNVKYTVKGELTSVKRHLHIYDTAGQEIAFVKEKLMTLRPSAALESHPTDFDLVIGGKRVGKLRSKWSITKNRYVLNNGWKVEGNAIGWKYKITAGDQEIARISKKLLYWGDTYLITFPEDENELLILMIVLAIDISNAPKRTEELKGTIHHKTNGWL